MAKCDDGRRDNRPPEKHQFKKGESGNPAGRRVGVRNRASMVLAAFSAKITINESGKRRKITKYEAGMIQLANKFALGDLKAFGQSIEILQRFDLMQEETAAFIAALGERDQPVVEDIVRRIREAGTENVMSTEKPSETKEGNE